MKKNLFLFGVAAILFSCGGSNDHTSRKEQESRNEQKKIDTEIVIQPVHDSVPPVPSELINPLDEILTSVAKLLRDKKFEELSKYVHPEKGLRFSPYTFVGKKDLVFNAAKLKKIFEDKTVYNWGSYDGSGEPISFTFKDYYEKFVYNKDFLKANQLSYDDFSAHGNTPNNIEEFYSGCKTINYFYPPSMTGNNMDWAILRFVFQKKDGKLFLVGIVHDQWTI